MASAGDEPGRVLASLRSRARRHRRRPSATIAATWAATRRSDVTERRRLRPSPGANGADVEVHEARARIVADPAGTEGQPCPAELAELTRRQEDVHRLAAQMIAAARDCVPLAQLHLVRDRRAIAADEVIRLVRAERVAHVAQLL